MTASAFIDLALSFPNTEPVRHFERIGFKVSGKRMFATFLEQDGTANIFLSPEEQLQFCALHPAAIFPVPNKWGEKGATTFLVGQLQKEVLTQALTAAYQAVPNKK